MAAGRRHQRSRKPGARMPEGTVYVGRGPGRAGRWGNPFRVGGPAATALALLRKADNWKGRQWAATALFAFWISDRLAELPAEVVAAARLELTAAGEPQPPTIDEIRAALQRPLSGDGRDVVCWCSLHVDCHGDILRAVAIGRDPVGAAGASPHWADNFRCMEAQRDFRTAEIREDQTRRRSRWVKGWTAW